MRKTYYILSLAFFLGFVSVYAQTDDTKKADKYFQRLEYVKAIEEYEDLVEDGDGTPYIYHQLAEAYFNIYNTEKSEYYYKMYIALTFESKFATAYIFATVL